MHRLRDRTETVAFAGALGDTLVGRLEIPEGTPRCAVVFAHCFTCSKDYLAIRRIAHGLVARGAVCLRFDFTGLGQSGGDFAQTSFSTNVEDIRRAAGVLRGRFESPLLLFGHSFGGAAALAAAAGPGEVRAVATLAAPSEPAQLLEHFSAYLPQLERQGRVRVEIGGRPYELTRQFADDARASRLAGVIAGLECAVMVFHSPEDPVVTVDHGERIFEWAPHPKVFVALDGADHLLTGRADARYVSEVIGAWLDRYL